MNRRINVSIESIMVTVLLIIFAIAISILIFEGTRTYGRIIESRSTEENTRIALSYVNMKVKQNDIEGNITIEEGHLADASALVIRHAGEEAGLISYVYFKDDHLYECYTDGPLDESISTLIIPAPDMAFEKGTTDAVIVNYHYMDNGTKLPMLQLTSLRTDQP